MARYTRKPKPIEVIKWDGTNEGMNNIRRELGVLTDRVWSYPHRINWHIKTKNGSKLVLPGHYVIKNEDGHFWTMHQAELDDYEKVEDLNQVFPDGCNVRTSLYESISEKICALERQKTIVFNEMRDIEHAEDLDKL